jgi:hypothetical protein
MNTGICHSVCVKVNMYDISRSVHAVCTHVYICMCDCVGYWAQSACMCIYPLNWNVMVCMH